MTNAKRSRLLLSPFWHHLLMRTVQFIISVLVVVLFMEAVKGPANEKTKGETSTALALVGGGCFGMLFWVGIGRGFRKMPARCKRCRHKAYITADTWTSATYTCAQCGSFKTYDTPTTP